MGAQAPYQGREVGDEAGKSGCPAQAKSSVSTRICGQDQDDASRERTAGSLPTTGEEGQTRTVAKRPETLKESASQPPRAISPEGRAVLPIPNATPVLGLDRRDDGTAVYPSPIDRPFDVLDSRKPRTGRACHDHPSGPCGADEWKEAASAQAVNRGPMVTMIEVPDDDDDMAYQQWLTKESPKGETAISPTPTSPPPNEGVGPDLR